MGGALLMQLFKRGPEQGWSPFGLVISVTAGLFIAGVVWWGASIELLPSGLPYRFSRTDRGVLKWEEISSARDATFLGVRYVTVESRGKLAIRLPVSVAEPDHLRSFVRKHVPTSCPLRVVLDGPQP